MANQPLQVGDEVELTNRRIGKVTCLNPLTVEYDGKPHKVRYGEIRAKQLALPFGSQPGGNK